MDGTLNPNHPVVMEAEDQWYKLCAILIHKFNQTEVDITAADVTSFATSAVCNIVLHSKRDSITLKLVSDADAIIIARQAGGLPT